MAELGKPQREFTVTPKEIPLPTKFEPMPTQKPVEEPVPA